MATTQPNSTRHRWWSVGLIVWISLCSIPAIYHNVHSHGDAVIIWIMVPWCGVLAYFRGRFDKKQEMYQEENQPWLYEELNEFLQGSAEHELLKVRTKFVFHQKNERD